MLIIFFSQSPDGDKGGEGRECVYITGIVVLTITVGFVRNTPPLGISPSWREKKKGQEEPRKNRQDSWRKKTLRKPT